MTSLFKFDRTRNICVSCHRCENHIRFWFWHLWEKGKKNIFCIISVKYIQSRLLSMIRISSTEISIIDKIDADIDKPREIFSRYRTWSYARCVIYNIWLYFLLFVCYKNCMRIEYAKSQKNGPRANVNHANEILGYFA